MTRPGGDCALTGAFSRLDGSGENDGSGRDSSMVGAIVSELVGLVL